MRKEDAHLLTPGTLVKVCDRFKGKILYGIDDPSEMEQFLGQVVTVKDVKEVWYSNASMIEVNFEEGDGRYFLIEEIDWIVEDKDIDESDMSIEDFLGIGGT